MTFLAQSAGAANDNQPFRQLQFLHYENTGGERCISTFDYDENGCPKINVWEQLDENRSSINSLGYDDAGNFVRKYREFSDGITSEELMEYDANNRLAKETFSQSDGRTGSTIHEYDSNGRLIRTVCNKHKGWFDGDIVYKWNDEKKIGAEISRNGERIGDITYDYDADGRLVREHWQLGDWSQTFRREYYRPKPDSKGSYTSANVFITPQEGYAVSGENYDYSGKSGGPSYYGYEPGGKLVAKRFVRSDGLMTNTAFLYDADRRLVRSYRVYADGRHGVFAYEFDDAGRLVNRTLRISDGATGSEKYEYDNDGRLTKAYWDNFDTWLTGTITFEYADGLLNKGFFKGKNDFDADITFQHDQDKHLVSIHWDLSFEGSQTYTFTYARYDDLKPLPPPPKKQPVKSAVLAAIDYPDTPAGKRVREVVDLINQGDRAAMVTYMQEVMKPEFLETYSADQQAGFWLDANQRCPDMFPVYIRLNDLYEILITLQSRTKQSFLEIGVTTAPEAPNQIAGMGFAASGPPPGAEEEEDPELTKELEELSNLPDGELTPIVFVCYVGNPQQLERAYGLAESIRTFAGKYSNAPIWIYGPPELTSQNQAEQRRFVEVGAALKSVEIPDEAGWYFLSGMVFAAAEAEAQGSGKAAVLVFLGSDTIVLQEPSEFILADGVSLGYCPVMHKNISPLYSEPLDTYWKRAYSIMKIDESTLFRMVTPADGDEIRPYFNAGCLVVRPELGLLKKRADIFMDLCQDSVLRQEAEQDEMKRVFTFQVALTGAILNNLKRGEMVELSKRYNYPIFFKEMYGAKYDFHDITNVATMRYEQFFDNPLPDWEKQLKGPADRIAWIKKHYLSE